MAIGGQRVGFMTQQHLDYLYMTPNGCKDERSVALQQQNKCGQLPSLFYKCVSIFVMIVPCPHTAYKKKEKHMLFLISKEGKVSVSVTAHHAQQVAPAETILSS